MVRHYLHNRSSRTYIDVIFVLNLSFFIVGRLNAKPLLDEEDMESDTPIPNRMVTEDDDKQTLG
jgi:hypothetical protein